MARPEGGHLSGDLGSVAPVRRGRVAGFDVPERRRGEVELGSARPLRPRSAVCAASSMEARIPYCSAPLRLSYIDRVAQPMMG
jgi:hypothetical protein